MSKINVEENMVYDDVVFQENCGCYNCKKIFSSKLITESIDNDANGELAVCPFCGEATVVGEISITITDEVLSDIEKIEKPSKFYRSR